MATSLGLYFSNGVEIRATAAVPLRADGGLGMTGTVAMLRVRPSGVTAKESRHLVFARDTLLPDTGSLIPIGTSGLLEELWGTVLDTDEGDHGDVEVQADDWGTVFAVGLVSQRRDVSVRCRIRTSAAVPRYGRLFRFRGTNFVTLDVRRVSKSGKTREILVTGARWEDLGGQSVSAVPDIINGWTD